MTEDKPRKIWLQVYDQEGNYMTPEDRTFSANERVNPTDICYVRWGKTDILSIERDAALARAEAAEAETADAINDLKIVTAKLARAERANALLAARVAELEAASELAIDKWADAARSETQLRLDAAEARVAELEAELAAQQWRPVTEDWPPYNERVIIGHGGGYGGGWSAFARRVRTDDRDDWLMDDDTTLAFESAVVAMRRPLPPAPQEPTP